jgi:hypothetical protein
LPKAVATAIVDNSAEARARAKPFYPRCLTSRGQSLTYCVIVSLNICVIVT